MRKIILGIFIGILISAFGVFAYQMNASQITYEPKDNNWKVNTVKSAIDSLKAEANSQSSLFSDDLFGIYRSKDLQTFSGSTKENGVISMNTMDALYSITNLNISKGCYFIVINGENLNNSLVFDAVTENDSTYFARPSTVKQTNHYAYYYLNITKDLPKGSIRVWNKSNNITKIKTTIVFNATSCS